MPDNKLTALTAIGTLNTTDIFYVVDDPGGSPLSRKATFQVVATLMETTLTALNPGGFVVNVGGGATATELRFLEPSGSGANYSSFKAAAQAGNISYTLPTTDAAGFMTSNGSGTLSWTLAASGVWTPTLTNVLNLDASTAYEGTYVRIGNTVVCSGQVDMDATAASAATQLRMSLPIASNFADTADAGGVANSGGTASLSSAIQADTTFDTLLFNYISIATVNREFYFVAAYRVI